MKSFLKHQRGFPLFPLIIVLAVLGCTDTAVAGTFVVATPGGGFGATFCYGVLAGTSPPVSQSQIITVTNTGAATPFTVSTATNSGGNWLSASPATGTASSTSPATVDVSVISTGLTEGTHIGLVTVTPTYSTTVTVETAGAPVNFPVTLVVGNPSSLYVSPSSVTFAYTEGGPAPAAVTVEVSYCPTGTSGTTNTIVLGMTSSSLFTTNFATATLPFTFKAGVNQSALTLLGANTYTGQITLSAGSLGTAAVNTSLIVVPAGTPGATSVVNAADFLNYTVPNVPATGTTASPNAVVSPGGLFTISGIDLAPGAGQSFGLTSQGTVPTTIGGVVVNFALTPSAAERAPGDTTGATPAATTTVAAPLLYVSSTQINAIVPYEIAGSSTVNMTVTYNGNTSTAVPLTVTPTNPAIFSLTETGYGQGAILNQDYSVNGVGNPAAKGSFVSVYATGEGVTSPPQATGSVTPSTGTSFPLPVGNVGLTIGGVAAQILYAGETPGDVAGLLQVTAYVPTGIASGPQPVVLTVGANSSASQVVLMYVQ